MTRESFFRQKATLEQVEGELRSTERERRGQGKETHRLRAD